MSLKTFTLTERLNAHAEEAYKVLRTNIQFCELEREIKTLTIISCKPGEGKSTTSINLGISIASTGKRVLVVDADLRKPMLMKQMTSDDFKGLSNYISGRVPLEEIVSDTSVDGLYFIPSGVKPPNPAELIASSRFSQFIEIVSEEFDMVIIDTPPLGNVIDGALVASKTDGTIIVIQYNSVNYQDVIKVKEQLVKASARILGVVLNKVDDKSFNRNNGYYDFYGKRRDLRKELLRGVNKNTRSQET